MLQFFLLSTKVHPFKLEMGGQGLVLLISACKNSCCCKRCTCILPGEFRWLWNVKVRAKSHCKFVRALGY